MKILVIGELSERQHEMLQERWAHVPGAELVFVKSEDFYQEPEPEPQKVWIDELSDFRPEPQRLEYKVIEHAAQPVREKVMHPWSRRKKR